VQGNDFDERGFADVEEEGRKKELRVEEVRVVALAVAVERFRLREGGDVVSSGLLRVLFLGLFLFERVAREICFGLEECFDGACSLDVSAVVGDLDSDVVSNGLEAGSMTSCIVDDLVSASSLGTGRAQLLCCLSSFWVSCSVGTSTGLCVVATSSTPSPLFKILATASVSALAPT
jgi:hypothetical protein